MSKNVYILMARGFEYNDEGYDVSEGGEPVRQYETRELAEAAVIEETLKKHLHPGGCPFTYADYWSLNTELFQSFIEGLYGEEVADTVGDRYDMTEWTIPKNSTREQCLAIAAHIKKHNYLEFYYVKEIPVA